MSSSDDTDSDDEPLVQIARGSKTKSSRRKSRSESSDDSEVEEDHVSTTSSSSDNFRALKLKEKSKSSAKSHGSQEQSRRKTAAQGNSESETGDSDDSPGREAKRVNYASHDSDHDNLGVDSSSEEVRPKTSSSAAEGLQPKSDSKTSAAEMSEDLDEDGVQSIDKAPSSPSSTSDSGVDDPLPVKKDIKEKKESKKETGKKAKKKTTQQSGESNRILSLKKYIRACGIHIQNYAKLFEDCRSKSAKERKLIDILSDAGIQGRPTLEKCRLVRLKREEAQEIAELDVGNIITSDTGRGRCTRARVTQSQKKTLPNLSDDDAFSNLKGIVDSDASEEEEEDRRRAKRVRIESSSEDETSD